MTKTYEIHSIADGITYIFHGFNTPVSGSRFKRPTFLSAYCYWSKAIYPRTYKHLKTAKKIAEKCAGMLSNSTPYHMGRKVIIIENNYDENGQLMSQETLTLA